QKANAAMEVYCNKTDNLYFIDSTTPYLNEEGIPRDELFIKDRLHQNQAGYDIWALEIKKELDKVLN
ncbi:MAG: lysophospholipase L1-like esterase, partial [Arcticibacterium sp.]